MGITFYAAGFTPAPKVGSWVELDTGNDTHVAENLLTCDDWDKAEFRFPVTSRRIPYAVNVIVTGRKLRWRSGTFPCSNWVRVKVTFVGDGEPDADRGGWMLVN